MDLRVTRLRVLRNGAQIFLDFQDIGHNNQMQLPSFAQLESIVVRSGGEIVDFSIQQKPHQGPSISLSKPMKPLQDVQVSFLCNVMSWTHWTNIQKDVRTMFGITNASEVGFRCGKVELSTKTLVSQHQDGPRMSMATQRGRGSDEQESFELAPSTTIEDDVVIELPDMDYIPIGFSTANNNDIWHSPQLLSTASFDEHSTGLLPHRLLILSGHHYLFESKVQLFQPTGDLVGRGPLSRTDEQYKARADLGLNSTLSAALLQDVKLRKNTDTKDVAITYQARITVVNHADNSQILKLKVPKHFENIDSDAPWELEHNARVRIVHCPGNERRAISLSYTIIRPRNYTE